MSIICDGGGVSTRVLLIERRPVAPRCLAAHLVDLAPDLHHDRVHEKTETCEVKAVGSDGRKLSGAAKTSFMKKCESGA